MPWGGALPPDPLEILVEQLTLHETLEPAVCVCVCVCRPTENDDIGETNNVLTVA